MKHSRYLKWVMIFVLIVLSSGILPALAQDVVTEREKLVAADASSGARFGFSVAADGDTAVIGAPGAQGSGAAYVFQRQSGNWVQTARLSAADGAANDQFGTSVAIDGGVIVVGAPGDDDVSGNSGAAYVFTGSGSAWTQAAKLLPGTVGDTFFGFSVAVNGSNIAVGAPFTDSGTTNSGAVYVFEAAAGGWSQVRRLATGSGGPVLSDLYGWAVALEGDLLVVGAYLGDSVYVYSRAAGWQQSAVLRGSDTQTNDRFGYSVATDGSRVLIGATHDSDAGPSAGTAFIFTLSNGLWQQEAKLVPGSPTPLNGTNFGWSVAISGNVAIVGAANSKGAVDAEEAGAGYSYTLGGGGWQQSALLTASDAADFDHLGTAAALAAGDSLLGAPDNDERGNNAGAVYVIGAGSPPPPPPPDNNPPVANDDTAETEAGFPVVIDVLANDFDSDGDTLTVTAVLNGTGGVATINPNNTITYTPDPGFIGTDIFSYMVSDGRGGGDGAEVTVIVREPSSPPPPPPDNTPPTANDDTAATEAGTPVVINVLANDTDQDQDILAVIAVTLPANGTAVINADSTVTYTPDEGFIGQDTFDYTISDGRGGEDSATVTVTVNAVSEQPIPPVPPAPPGQTVVEVVIALNTSGEFAGQFNTLIAALAAADPSVLETLSGSGQFTVFAPTDAAFEAAGITLDDPAAVTNILLYHVAPGRRDSGLVLSSNRIFTLNGGFLLQEGGVLTDNQERTAAIIAMDQAGGNGIVHVIDQVMLP